MRGIGQALSRLPVARAIVLGAAVLAASAVPKAYGQPQPPTEDTALAVPRLAPRGSGDLGLPHPLPPSEAARLRRLFALQSRGAIAEAVRQSMALDHDHPVVIAVLGHLLADRHLGPHTRTTAAELQEWLERWPTLPDGPAIHSLLKRRLARGTKVPPAPATAALPLPADAIAVPEELESPGPTLPRLPTLDRRVREAARSPNYGAASRAILAARDLPPGYAALLRGEAGQILFALNRDREAYEVAAIGAESCQRSPSPACVTVAAAGHWAGLAAWRQGRIAQSRAMFELAWAADIASASQRAAAAFWAARAHQRLGDPDNHAAWLLRAAAEDRTFHGLIARRSLGMALEGPPLPRETLGEADLDAVASHPAGLRAFALLQIGQHDRAEAELRLLWPETQHAPGLGRALMLVAEHAGMPGFAAQLADLAQATDGRPRERTRFAIPRLRPAGGFTTDPALVYAIARTESNFDPAAISPAGAQGLMQIMPGTARFLAGLSDSPDRPLPALHDPAINLNLGQRYLNFLAATDIVAGDKIRLLASYNSGPSAFGRWSAPMRDGGDPLLFIEAIPIDETRAFVPRVLTHTWLYAARLGLPAPSLDQLATGAWPRYAWDDGAAPIRH
jgi:soluble lytic murein transglycosylase